MGEPQSSGLLEALAARRSQMVADLEALTTVETPSSDLDALVVGMALLADLVRERWAVRPVLATAGDRPYLLVEPEQEGGILLLGHLDTVWPHGTLDRWPFAVEGGQATGPGVFDMKAGLVQGLHAVAALIAADRLVDRVGLLVTSDEEIGSPRGRQVVEAAARRASAVLVLEPSAGGALKIARKGVSMYQLHVWGRAAHAGLEPEHGVNALVELAAQVPAVVRLARPEAGTTVTPTTATAGTTRNTVPARAELGVDVRAETAAELTRVDSGMRGLAPVGEATLHLDGGINRPPLEATAWACAADLGLAAVRTARVGGGSDGNFTAGLGIPTLDGLGAVGDHAHAEGEYVDLDEMTSRAAMLAHLTATLIERLDPPGHNRSDIR